MENQSENIKHRKWFRRFDIFFLIVWILVFFWLMILRDKYIQITVPGESDITLTTAGNYTVFHEYEGVGSLYNASTDLAGLQCTLYSKSTGGKIQLNYNDNPSKYTRWIFYKGRAILTFTIEQPGIYKFSGQYTGRKGDSIILTIPYRSRSVDYLIIFTILVLGAIVTRIVLNKIRMSREHL